MTEKSQRSKIERRVASSFRERQAAISLVRLLVYGMHEAQEFGREDLGDVIREMIDRMKLEYGLSAEETCLPTSERHH